jgi:TPP-dependent 2-oxoacid decarboxylase
MFAALCRPVTCYQTILRSYFDARYLIDKALTKCLQHRKPVLMEVCRDLPMTPHSSFGHAPPHMTPFSTTHSTSDATCLQAAVQAAKAFFADKHLPVVVLGRRAR